MDSEYLFKVSLADDLRIFPEWQRQIARHEIQSVIFKHQTNTFAGNYQGLRNYNYNSQPSQNPYYGLPSSPLFIPTILSPIGSDSGSSQIKHKKECKL